MTVGPIIYLRDYLDNVIQPCDVRRLTIIATYAYEKG